jgi:hypothetical protein
MLEHRLPLRLRGVAGAHRGADLGDAGQRPQLGQRLEQVLAHVVGQRLQGRDVEHLRRFGQGVALADHRIQAGEKGRERLARARGGGDERVLAALDARPAEELRLGGRAEAGLEPVRDRRVEAFEHGIRTLH